VVQHLEDKILAAQKRLASLKARTGQPADQVLDEALEELSANLEELSITAEELREENEELLATRELVDAGRKRYQELFDRAPDGYVVTDTLGNVVEVNHAAAVLFGKSREWLVAKPMATLVAQDHRKIFRGIFAELRRGTPVPEIEVRMRRGADDGFDALLHVDCDFDDAGSLVDLRWLVIDVSDRLAATRKLQETHALLEATAFGAGRLLRATRWEDGMGRVLSGLGRSAGASRATVVQTVGGPEGSILARHRFEWRKPGISSVVQQLDAENLVLDRQLFGPWLEALEGGEAIRVVYSDLPPHVQALLDGFGIRTALVVPIFVDGDWWGFFVLDDSVEEHTWSDPTVEAIRTAAEIIGAAIHRSEMERAIARSEELFRRLAENAQDVVYRYRLRPQRGFEYVSPAVTAIYGYAPDEFYADPNLGLRIVHPDDADLLRTSMMPTVQALADPIVIRWIHKDGGIAWTEHRNVPVLDAAGTIVAIEGIAREVTERKHEEAKLLDALEHGRDLNAKMQAVDEAKTAIVHAASHDLRAPLSSLLGFALTLQARFDELGSSDRREILDRMVNAARRLDRGLESDLIEIERISSGVVGPVRVPTDLSALARLVANSVDKRDHDILLDVDQVTIDIDPVKVERIIENLLSNAVKHTPPGSHIWLKLFRDARNASIVVEDDGPGIAEDEQSSIFEAFQRGEGTETTPGMGVGLSLVQRLAELHGGHAWVERRPGGGASFVVTLPADASAEAAGDDVSSTETG
jgi:PAS domain S-box-containing protein